MNTKTLKTKPIAALAVAILIVMPMLLVTTTIVKGANNPPVLSVVLSGTTTTLIPAQSVGTTFNVDIRVDNTGSVSPGINSYSYGLTWNPAVLNVTNVNDAFSGSFLNSGANQGTVQSLGDLPPDNTNGLLIIGDIILNTAKPAAAATGSGVLTTVTFTVLAAGQSNINLRPSDVGVAYLSYPDNQGNSHDVVATTVNAQYNTTTSISLYQSGSSNPTVQAKLINSNISVDIFLNNPLAGNVWGWNVGVSWDPTVLQLKTVTEGTYLNPIGNSQTLFLTGNINNQKGTIQSGISDIYLSNMTTDAVTGVLATLTFQVTKLANSTISLTAGTPTLTDNHSNSITCTLTNATVITHAAGTFPNDIPGDINGDGKVNLSDLVLFAKAYGSKPGDPNWNPAADINGHGKVDLSDLVTLAQHYGQTYNP